jgi:ubiquinone/menaquinone biosynthesis C-methylase UbiE
VDEVLTQEAARELRASWDRQQEPFLPHRKKALDVVVDLIAQEFADDVRDEGPYILDLAGGPGTLAARVRQAVPRANVAVLDVDPVLTEIARRADDETTVLEADLSQSAWVTAIEHRIDAVVVANALHSFESDRLAALYAEIRTILEPGGALIVAEVMPKAGALVRFPGSDPMGPWQAWWADALTRRELAGAAARRRQLADLASADFYPSPEWHLQAAEAAGFTARVTWQDDDVTVLIARPAP